MSVSGRRLKVAVVTDYFPTSATPWGGHSAYQTLRKLALMCDVHVFCSVPAYPRVLQPKKASAPVDFGWRPADVEVTYVSFPVLPVVSRPLNGFSVAWKLLPQVRAFAPDVVLNYVVYPQGFSAVRIARALGVPSVLTAIGSDLNRISDRLSGVMTKSALRDANVVTTVSHDLAGTAVALGAAPERTRAIVNGCDTSVFSPRDRQQARTALGIAAETELVLYVGRLDVRKGLLELIEAVARLHATRPALEAHILGDGPDKPLLTEAIARHHADSYIKLLASRPTADVAEAMAAADLVTLPSYKEGCPNVVLEALAAGRPMVATNVGGIPELMDDSSGRLVPAKDVHALAAGLDAVLQTRWDAAAIASQHNRSWTDVAADVYAVLQEAVSMRSSR